MNKPIEFDKKQFISLSMQRYQDQWNTIGLSDLMPAEQKLMTQFLSELRLPETDLDNLLLVKADSNGLLIQVYGPSIAASDDGGLVLHFGNNITPVALDEASAFVVGDLEGFLSVETVETSKGTSFVKAFVTFGSSVTGAEYKLSCRLVFGDDTITASGLQRAIRTKKKYVEYFTKVGSNKGGGGSGGAIKMQELGEGEFTVVGARDLEVTYNGSTRTSFILQLDSGVEVWSRGDASTILEAGFLPTASKPMTLVVRDIQQSGDKTYLKSALITASIAPVEEIPSEDIPL